MRKTFWVYIITNHVNFVLYTGITNDLLVRKYQHKTGNIKSSFSRRYKLYKIIWFEAFSNPQDAIAAEKKIKGWTRKRKLDLIQSKNPEFKDLIE